MTPAPSPASTWWDLARPFRHILVEDFLPPDRYAEVSALFDSFRRGEDPRLGDRRFRCNSDKYDALVLPIDRDISDLFSPFFDADWLAGVAGLLGIPFLPLVDGALHSSPAGSRTGWIHSDYCSAWFHQPRVSGDMLFPDRSRCDYFSGQAKLGDAAPRRYIRGATMLYYLNNDGWAEGDGGETELLSASRELAGAPVKRVAPKNNRLVIFACNHHSFHRFVTNRRERNSLVMWMHLSPSMAATVWGPPSH